MSKETTTPASGLRKLTAADIKAVGDYIATNATVMKNDKGKEFIGLNGFRHSIAGLEGQLRFGYFGLSNAGESQERTAASLKSSLKKLTADERLALLAELENETPDTPEVAQ
jgi:hypothetical protein